MREVTVTQESNDLWSTLTVKDDLIAVSRSQHVTGKNKYSGKSFSRFKQLGSTFVSWRGGRMRVYRKGDGLFRDETTQALENPSTYLHGMYEAFKILRGLTVDEEIARQYPLLPNASPLNGVTPLLAQVDAATLTKAVFGERQHRKDLVKSVGGILEYAPNDVTSFSLLMGRAISGTVPIDWVVSWLPMITRSTDSVRGREFESSRLPVARRMFKSMSDKQRRRLITTDGDLHGFRDTVRMFERIQQVDNTYKLLDTQFTSFKELHNVLARDERRLQEPLIELGYTGKAKKLVGNHGEYRIIAPKTNHDLIDWGTQMRNCIGGYGYHVASGQSALYAVEKDGEMIANIELHPKTGNVRQLLGKYNSSIEPTDRSNITEIIQSVWPEATVNDGWF